MPPRTYAATPIQMRSGTYAARPAVGGLNQYYWATDIYTLFRGTGVGWEIAAEPSPFYSALIVGRWCQGQGIFSTSPGTYNNIPADTLYGCITWFSRRVTLDQIGIQIPAGGAGGAGAAARLGIYDNIQLGPYPAILAPNNLLVDAGAVDCTAIGVKTLAINITLNPGWYYLAYLSNDATIDCLHRNAGIHVNAIGTMGTNNLYWSVAQVYGALPNPFTAGGSFNGNFHFIAVRIGALP